MATNSIVDHSDAPSVSVIVPVYNGAAFLNRCLTRITETDGVSYECLVVNDSSTDGSETIARRFPVRVLDLVGGPFGPAFARNRGANVARGKILLFVDADVVLNRGAICRVATLFREQPDLAAVFGSYDSQPEGKGVVSQFRNLLHHHVHQSGKPEASTFWAGCGAIRRPIFQRTGGFDEKKFSRPSIEDIELGYRLRHAGHRILLDKDLQCTHLKQWTLLSVLRADILCRAIPWSRLIFESNIAPNDLNIKTQARLSFSLVAIACIFLLLAALRPVFLALAILAILAVIILNRDLYGLFLRQRGLLFTAACLPLHLLYYLYSGLSYLSVWARFRAARKFPRPGRSSRRQRLPTSGS